MLDIVLGAQYGDEGKGRIVDYLCSKRRYKSCIRVNGSDNAGHTVHLPPIGERFSFRQIPIGAFHGMVCMIARGCMLDLKALDAEIKEVEQFIETHKINKGWSLLIDERCHIKTDYHIALDKKQEKKRAAPIGTTLTGNGPAYAGKYARDNLRLCDIDLTEYENISRVADITDISKAVDSGRHHLVEGAHGVMLDIDHGTYPFVTSSACTAAGACHSIGISPKAVREIIGVIKPYITRVGAGAFPTEIQDEDVARFIREKGHEYGTNTKRPRRIGWLDAVALNYAIRVSGINKLAICKLDMLDVITGDLPVCYAYRDRMPSEIPASDEEHSKVDPQYTDVPHVSINRANILGHIIKTLTGIPVSIVADLESVSEPIIPLRFY